VEGAGGFAAVAGEIVPVFETNGADGEVDADTEASGKFKFAV